MADESRSIQFTAGHGQYDPSDDRWQQQVQELLASLKEHAGPVSKKTSAQAGSKGGAEQIILALGTAGAIQAAVAVFKAWLGRDKKRVLKVRTTAEEIEITGDNISEEMLEKALNAGAARR